MRVENKGNESVNVPLAAMIYLLNDVFDRDAPSIWLVCFISNDAAFKQDSVLEIIAIW